MKTNHLFPVLMLCMMILGACKKDDTVSTVPDVITAKDFTYNIALKQVTPDEEINADISSPTGAKLVYCYLVRTNKPDSLIFSGTPAKADQNLYHFSIPTVNYASAAGLEDLTGIKVMVKHLDNSSYEGFIKVTGFTPPLPALTGLPASSLPDVEGKISLTGTASSENGLKEIDIYDDYQGTYVLVDKISITNGAKSYALNYSYTYRENAANIKVTAVDNFDLTASSVIQIPLRSYTLYQDITMMVYGTATEPSTSSFFLGKTGTTIGNCEISGQETNTDFLVYCSSATPVFTIYSPANAVNIAKSYKCGAEIWAPDAGTLKATHFRVLLPGTAAVDQIYAAYNSNSISDLNDAFFDGILAPGSSTAKFDASPANQAANIFNLTTAYLIWVRVPNADGVTFTNELMRVKEVNVASTAALSTFKFDILVSR